MKYYSAKPSISALRCIYVVSCARLRCMLPVGKLLYVASNSGQHSIARQVQDGIINMHTSSGFSAVILQAIT